MRTLEKIWDVVLYWLIVLGFTLFSFAFATWPEWCMYGAWHLVNPTEEGTKVLLIALFVFGGGGLSVIFGILGVAMWFKFMAEMF